jgi:GAF domain-containing protein
MAESRSAREQLWGDIADLDAHGVEGSVLLAPVAWNGTTAGVLVIGHADDHVFGDNELSFAATLGRLAGQVVVSSPSAS